MTISNLTGGGCLTQRRRMMTGAKNKPYDAEIEYLEVSEQSDGAPMIVSDYVPTERSEEMEITFLVPSWNVPYSTLYTTESSGSGVFCIRRNNTGSTSLQVLHGYQSNLSTVASFSFNAKTKLEIKDEQIYVNDKLYKALDRDEYAVKNKNPIQLFSAANGKSAYNGRIYSFVWYKAGAPVLDLIPVRVGDEGYMYDRVSGKLFGNSGTGRFILGPDIN